MNSNFLDELQAVVARIPEIDPERQYWFIRTNGGDYYQDFLDSSSVGIGYNLVTYAQITKAISERSNPDGGIVKAIISRYPDFDKNKLGRVTGLFSRFYTEVKPGDVVVMPSASSVKYAFGIVTDGEAFEVDTETTDDKLIYRKRRPVEWITEKFSRELDSNLYEAFRAPQALSTLNPFASYLDREMHSLYTKGGLTHLRLDITTSHGINGPDYFTMGGILFSLCQDFREQADIPLEGSEIEIRQNIQSRGVLELIGKNKMLTGGFLATLLIVGLYGGEANFDFTSIQGGKTSMKTGGLFPNALDFYKEYNKQKNIEMFASKLDTLDAKHAADMMRIVSGQAPVAQQEVPEHKSTTRTDSTATASSSAATATSATASLSSPAKQVTSVDSASKPRSPRKPDKP